MAGKVRNLTNRDGRYFARLVIPVKLRAFMGGKSELRTALGADYREALRKLPTEVVALQHKISLGEGRAAAAGEGVVVPGRYPLSDAQIALLSYQYRLVQDQHARNANPSYAQVGIDDGFVAQLRSGISGALHNADLNELVGHRIAHFRKIGNTTAVFGSEEWRALARAICISEYEALERMAERDEGRFDGKLTSPLLIEAVPPITDMPPVPLRELFAEYVAGRQLIGSMRDGGRRQAPVLEGLIKFVNHNDARRLSRRNILDWRDDLMKSLQARTVSDVHLATIRSLLRRAVENERLPSNVAKDVRQPKPKVIYTRERGYTSDEALAVLKFSRSYQARVWANNRVREHAKTIAAKRWISLLCAFTGARVSEMAQLRKEDIRKEGVIHILRITPDAGTVKSGGYRDVPMHKQIVDQGFLVFVDSCGAGPLFSRTASSDRRIQIASATRSGNQVSDWLGRNGLVPKGLAPNHAFRHRFKTIGRDIGVSERVIDAICGHAGRTAGDDYGDVTVTARQRAIAQFPDYEIG